MLIIKKDGTKELFDNNKILKAINKSADRVMHKITDSELAEFMDKLQSLIGDRVEVAVNEMHYAVEAALENVMPDVAKSYKDYRNYKTDFVYMLDDVYQKAQSIMYIGDKDNANTDSALVATKRSLVFNALNKELYKKFFLTTEELQAAKDGYIYIHDMSARRDTVNCCLFDVGNVMRGGFEMGNVWYNEPGSLDTSFDVMGDIILATAAQQYGGFTVPEVDKILAPYAEKSYNKYFEEAMRLYADIDPSGEWESIESQEEMARKHALEKVRRDFEQGWQGIEYKLNTVGSSRGDYPFVTVSLGLGTNEFEKMCSITLLNVHAKGQGKKGFEKPVLFPKIVFLYDSKLHGPGMVNEDVFEAGIYCSSKAMYPDWLSLEPGSYVGDIYQKYGQVVSPMGCRAFLSPWYERGGMNPADENDAPVYVGRFNLGAISLNLPMIFAKSLQENKDFYEVLEYYMELIRNLHRRTYDYIGEMKASVNPLAYCEGGFYKGYLKPTDKIKPILDACTMSYGITALNELQYIYNGKSIREDGQFAIEVMEYINNKLAEYKKEDGILYAVYGTPAETLCGLQIEQFRAKYGIVENVSSRPYVSNSFHCGVWEDITPIEKQDKEKRFWNLFNGGKIQYVRYPVDYNIEAIRSLVRRAMSMGFYEGVNLSLSYCEDCGYEQLEMDVCPKCGSMSITKIDRMNGYLGYTKVKGDTRYNEAKNAEIRDRVKRSPLLT